jgi:hypothetical protein
LCILLVSPPIPAQEGAREGAAQASDEEAGSERPELPDLEGEDLLRPDFKPEKSEGIEEIKITTTQSELTAQDEAVSVTQFSAADIQDFRIHIKVYTNKPDGEFSGFSTLSYGNYNLLELETGFGFPIIGDILSARIAGTANFRDGYTQNKCRNAPSQLANQICDVNGDNFNIAGHPDLFPIARSGRTTPRTGPCGDC